MCSLVLCSVNLCYTNVVIVLPFTTGTCPLLIRLPSHHATSGDRTRVLSQGRLLIFEFFVVVVLLATTQLVFQSSNCAVMDHMPMTGAAALIAPPSSLSTASTLPQVPTFPM
jgi:hypothetical protein